MKKLLYIGVVVLPPFTLGPAAASAQALAPASARPPVELRTAEQLGMDLDRSTELYREARSLEAASDRNRLDAGEWVRAAEMYLESAERRQAYTKLRQRRSIDFPLLTIAVSAEMEGDGTVRALDGVVTMDQSGRVLEFNEAAEESVYLQGIIQFLERFRAEMERTAAFCRRLAELELLEKKDLQVTDGVGRRYRLRDFRMVDESKLAALDDATLGELHRTGQLGWIYAHLLSLGSATRLPARQAGRAGSDEQASVEATEPTG